MPPAGSPKSKVSAPLNPSSNLLHNVSVYQELTPVDNPSIQQHQEPTHNAKPHPPRKTFASLSQIDQITVGYSHPACGSKIDSHVGQYCTNVLLPEATLQLLLWRSGLRQSRELLSPSEEEELHSLAEEKSKEIDWVHQIVYAKRGATGSMLPSLRSDQALKPTEAVAGTLRSGRNR